MQSCTVRQQHQGDPSRKHTARALLARGGKKKTPFFGLIAHASLHERAPRATPHARHAVLIPSLWSLGYPRSCLLAESHAATTQVAHRVQCSRDIVGVRGKI